MDDIELWKEKIPPHSHIFKGFTIVNLTDVTIDDAISELKTTLLFEEVNEEEELAKLQEIFRSIYNISDLRVGFTVFNKKEMVFERMDNKEAQSFILDEVLMNDCESGICEKGFKTLIDDNLLSILRKNMLAIGGRQSLALLWHLNVTPGNSRK